MFDTCILASTLKHGTVQTLHEANKVVKKRKSEHVTLKFQNLGDDDSLKLVVFSDASMGNLPDVGTQGGHLIDGQGRDILTRLLAIEEDQESGSEYTGRRNTCSC